MQVIQAVRKQRGFLVAGLLLLGVCLLLARPAQACSMLQQPDFETLKESAPAIFIGTVRTVENGLAIFHVEKWLKGNSDEASFEVDEMMNTCGIVFSAGQRWLYMGNNAASGSQMLMTETGHVLDESVAFVKEHFGEAGAAAIALKGDVVGGTIEDSCAPWDGAAFSIRLESGVNVMVYERMPEEVEGAGKIYSADGKSEAGHASIVYCPKPQAGKVENLPCQSSQGTVTIGNIKPDTVNGQIETQTPDGEYHSRTVFKVKRLQKRMFCG